MIRHGARTGRHALVGVGSLREGRWRCDIRAEASRRDGFGSGSGAQTGALRERARFPEAQ